MRRRWAAVAGWPGPALVCLVGAALVLMSGCSRKRTVERDQGQLPKQGAPPPSPTSDARPNPEPDDGTWTRPAKDYASTRYSELAQITPTNVASLKPVATFSTGVLRGHEAAPLIVNKTMYVVTPYPNVVYALDLTQPGFPTKWVYRPTPDRASQGVACCDVVNRGAVYANGKIIFNTLDNHTIALDAATGVVRWNTKLGDVNLGETMTMAPLVVKDKVLVGNSGGELGVRGWLAALDVNSGALAWKAYNTGPDADVLIGSGFHPFYAKDRGTNLGVQSWPGDAWKIGGATVWGWLSYDPQLDLVYYGTSNPGPWNPEQRPGDNKWSSTIFARKPETGEAVWAYQMTPHDMHDYDGVNENVLLNLTIGGRARRVLVHPDRNGYVYVMDRGTGEVVSAAPFVPVNTSTGVDLKTGELQYNPAKQPTLGHVVRDVCPSSSGGKDWQPSSFSPRTGLLYIPHNNLCMDVEPMQANYIAGTPYVGMDVKMYAGSGGNRGALTAWDPATGRAVWEIPERFPVWGGTVVTAGGVLFYGTMDGWFKAVDARTGQLLWRYKTGSGVIGQPVTYRGPDGKQYVAVLDGVGGWAGGIVSGDLDARDSSAALGFVNAMKDLPQYTTKGGTLYVFGLP